jgi:hypothetical protein
VAIAVLIPSLVSAARELHSGVRDGRHFQDLGGRLATTIRLAGGRDAILSCGAITTRNFQVPLVAWQLHVHLERLGIRVTSPGTVFQQAQVPRIPAPLVHQFRTVADLGGSSLSSWRVQTSCATR